MSRAFTRQEFYDLVWSKPMTHLAKDFALSDVALHKVCRKHDVPTPPPGWWATRGEITRDFSAAPIHSDGSHLQTSGSWLSAAPGVPDPRRPVA